MVTRFSGKRSSAVWRVASSELPSESGICGSARITKPVHTSFAEGARSSGSVTSAPATLAVAAPSLTQFTARHVRAGGPLLWGIAAGGGQVWMTGTEPALFEQADAQRFVVADGSLMDG